jgi:hypothetical protein
MEPSRGRVCDVRQERAATDRTKGAGDRLIPCALFRMRTTHARERLPPLESATQRKVDRRTGPLDV